ncbi:14732_t:CDS:1, partial [Funneliformis caledonium]
GHIEEFVKIKFCESEYNLVVILDMLVVNNNGSSNNNSSSD